MPIDIRNINEITFTQSMFRGYNTEEVDDFLDGLYDEAVANNKEINELKSRIKELEEGGFSALESEEGGHSKEEAYAIIANAQEEADKIIEAARLKAHALIESAEKTASQKAANVPVASEAPVYKGISVDAVSKLKSVLKETYDKQMGILNGVSNDVAQPQPETKAYVEPQIPAADDTPSVSFSGLTRRISDKIPAERDILGEINSIGAGGFTRVEEPEPEVAATEPEEQETQPQSAGFTFAFGDDDEEEPVNAPEQPSYVPNGSAKDIYGSSNSVQGSYQEAEDPDDIIAQILRDNNRN